METRYLFRQKIRKIFLNTMQKLLTITEKLLKYLKRTLLTYAFNDHIV